MKKKVFLGQAVTGCDFDSLKEESLEIVDLFKSKGLGCYCTLCEGKEFQSNSKKEIFKHAFEIIDESDILLAVQRNENKSEGLLIEIGYCMANNKKVIIAMQKDVNKTYLPDLFDEVIIFDDFEDLKNKLKDYKF
ncbi:MAG: nucleoside 2-deoxyribosyltransferase [Candidatus Pacearchaeota archaeon]|nr:nucleoside 2-deoxyribosyltransferase [Candidatus Pacearchaeota archaeon]